MKAYNSTEDPARLSTGFTDVILSIFDKSLIDREGGELFMQFTPDCYTEGYKALSFDSGQINQILKEADCFVHRLLQADKVSYESKPGDIKTLQSSETKRIVAEVMNTIITYISDDMAPASNQVQLQMMLGDIVTLKIWKACFGSKAIADDSVKALAHKVLVGFFDELPQQYLVQTCDKFLAEGIIEGLFEYSLSPANRDLTVCINTFYLLSRVVVNKKLEQYIFETDMVKTLLNRMLHRDVFLQTYMKKGNDNLCSHFASIAEALFELANTSNLCSEMLEKQVTATIDTVINMATEVSSFLKTYLTQGTMPTMISEELECLWGTPADKERFAQYLSLFEEFSQCMMHFFRRFLDVESTNLTVKMIENGYLAKVLDLFLVMPCPNWTNISDRVQTFADGFASIGYHGMSASKVQINCLKNHCFPKLVAMVIECRSMIDTIEDIDIRQALSMVYRQSPVDSLPSSITSHRWSTAAIDLAHQYAKISFICGLTINAGIGAAFANDASIVNESDFMTLVDFYAVRLQRRLFPVQSAVMIQVMRDAVTAVERLDDSIASTKDIKDELAKIRQHNILFSMTITLVNIYNTQFANNAKVASMMFTMLGSYAPPAAVDGSADLAQSVIQHMEIISLSYPFMSSVVQQSVTSIVAIYESGLFGILNAACHSLFTLLAACRSALDSPAPHSVDQVILNVTLNHRMASIANDTVYSLIVRSLTPQDKFYRNGQLCSKEVGHAKARSAKLKIYEGLNSLVVNILKLSSENFASVRMAKSDYVEAMQASGKSSYKLTAESQSKVRKTFKGLLVHFLKMAIAVEARDPLIDVDRGIDRSTKQPPRAIIQKLLELGFDEDKVKIAARHVRNPKDFNEMCEWLLANGDTAEANAGEPMDEERLETSTDNKAISCLIDAPAKEVAEYKSERVDQYKRFCQTLIKYFLFIPKSVEFVTLLSNYTSHVHDNSNSGKSARQFLFDLYYLFVDFLILLKGQLSKLRSSKDFDAVDVSLPAKFNKVKLVVSANSDRFD